MPQKNPERLKFVLVVHGAEIFDAGEVTWLIARLRPVRTIVAGVMARTAAEESGLPVEYDGAPPSRIVRALDGPVVLANHAKTPESGKIFGNIIASRLDNRGLVQIECSDETIIVWDGGDRKLALESSERTGYTLAHMSSTPSAGGTERRIRGCLPGESVYMNGIIIGKATGNTVVLRKRGSSIEAISGLDPKDHGLEKLENTCPDIATAWCKSGPIRLSPPSASHERAGSFGRIVVIDHCGHGLYSLLGPECCGVLAIGDDTTTVCGHICFHRGVPVLGIVDGDRDTLLPSAFSSGSVVLEAVIERDDDIGKEIASMTGNGTVTWDDWVSKVIVKLGTRVRIRIDTREIP